MVKQHIPVITLDGPSGTGKGTLAHLLAEHLRWHVLDSGALYRAAAWAVLQQGVSMDDVARACAILDHTVIDADTSFEHGPYTRISCNGVDITSEIRTLECAQMASQLSQWPDIRHHLLKAQRDCRKLPGLVADGRDMGTVIFPDADLKIFLDADPMERANRRLLQLQQKGINASLREVQKEVSERDERDKQRAISPTVPASDAVIIDTTQLSVDEVFEEVLRLKQERLP